MRFSTGSLVYIQSDKASPADNPPGKLYLQLPCFFFLALTTFIDIDSPRHAIRNTGIVHGAVSFAESIDVQSWSISFVVLFGSAMNAYVFSSTSSDG